MPFLAFFDFLTWEGSIQPPGSKGPRLSSCRTVAKAEDDEAGWTLAYSYSGLVSPAAAYVASPADGIEFVGVRVAGVTIDEVKAYHGSIYVRATWSLMWG